jgi:hypothetical protein
MFPPRWFLPYDAVFQLVLSLVALAVAFYALRGHRYLRERTLFALFLSFLLLSIGMFVNGLTLSTTYLTATSFSRTVQPMTVADLGFWIYYLICIVALSVLLYAYADRLRGSAATLAGIIVLGASAGGSLLNTGPVLEMVIAVMLAFVVMVQLVHYYFKRNRFSLLVAISFLLILLSHVLIMISSIEDILYVLARLIELSGFLVILGVLYMLWRVK